MKIKGAFFLFTFLMLVAIGCKKNKEIAPETGIYRGVFSRILTGDDTAGTGVVYFALNEDSRTFTMRGDTSSNAPYTCNGNYGLMGPGRIFFKNTSFIGELVSDPFYDPHYYLDTAYTYVYTDSSLVLELDFDTVLYNYNLSSF